MKYRLKDQELQKKLDELTDGDFTKKLNSELQFVYSPIDPEIKYRVRFGDQPDFAANRFSAIFRADEVEEILEYDPTKWNQYPSVTPPEDVWMRFEDLVGDGYRVRFEKGEWLDVHNDIMKFDAGRYRPWED